MKLALAQISMTENMQENLEKMPGSMEIKGYFREGEQ